MSAILLTPAQRKPLKAKAHSLKPVIMIGHDGFSPAVAKEIDLALDSHGLIKVRVLGDDRELRQTLFEAICDQLNAAPIQHIGKLFVIWRQPEVPIEKPVVKKTTKQGAYAKKPVVKKTNRTTGSRYGLMPKSRSSSASTPSKPKRRKVRQASPKKQALD